MEPTPEQCQDWTAKAFRSHPWRGLDATTQHLARLAYAAGADAELDACCEWLSACGCVSYGRELRTARRPQSLSLKQQAIKALDRIWMTPEVAESERVIRLALDALPDD